MDFNNKKIAILGMGIEGKDAINFLLKKGAAITLFDKKEEEALDFTGIEKDKIGTVTGENYLEDGLLNFDYIVRSPGVYRYISEIVDAENARVKVTSAVKIFFEECSGKIIGVTGTKGKGTTSTLIYEILKADGQDVYLSGNIGKPYLELLPKLSKDSVIVMEMSSFQLIDMDISPHIAVVLNITEDHMDWHVSRAEYVNAKKNIVSHQTEKDFAVINYDYEDPKSFAKLTKGKVYYFSKEAKVKGSYVHHVHNVHIDLNVDQKEHTEIGEISKLLLRGEHNWENITAAVCASYLAGASIDSIRKTIFSFKGLEHRLELVGNVKGRTFYNDSFATGPQPTIAAINSFTEPETLILGGSDKGLDYRGLGEAISKKKNIKNVILIGDTKLKIENSLKIVNWKLKIVDLDKSDMTKIVETAYKITEPGGVVILSPASASFDMFKNYKDRGNQFKKAVQSLLNDKK